MFKVFFKTVFHVLLALGLVFGALAVLQYFSDRRTNYIEIYNEGEDEDEDFDDEDMI